MTRHESGRQLLYPETCLNDSLGRLAWGEGYVNPIWPSLFWCIRDLGCVCVCVCLCVYVPPLNIFGLGGVRVPILFGNGLPRSDLPYTNGFKKFGCPESSKKFSTFETFVHQRGA